MMQGTMQAIELRHERGLCPLPNCPAEVCVLRLAGQWQGPSDQYEDRNGAGTSTMAAAGPAP
ncbi:MAG: hypothetical protein ACKPKO_01695, partial [Candidatus Fonsibacter sp.]